MAQPIAPPADVALSLGLAVIASSNTPLVLLDDAMTVLAASGSFCVAFALPMADVVGRPLASLGAGEWNAPQLASLLTATGSGFAEVAAYEMDLVRPGAPTRKLVLNAHKLEYDGASIRLVLAVADVTEARLSAALNSDLLKEKAVLLDEIQHRVANSLQIIASVLMQSARKVSSEETRAHLRDAHGRVMSVAAVQQQLAASRIGDVGLRAYFTQLCQSLGASMISDPDQLSIVVEVDDTVVKGAVSISLGLIVTELVINALKHAFPGERRGRIVVAYQAHGAAWTLSVTDDGVGMPRSPGDAKPGLGTSIVEALARQREASVQVKDADPGTTVSIIHDPTAIADPGGAAPLVEAV